MVDMAVKLIVGNKTHVLSPVSVTGS